MIDLGTVDRDQQAQHSLLIYNVTCAHMGSLMNCILAYVTFYAGATRINLLFDFKSTDDYNASG